MSNINIKRAVENIRSTTVFTPIVETIVNAIEAIEAANVVRGLVKVRVHRSPQRDLADEPGGNSIVAISVEDNGIGFTQENRDSFDTLYSEHKIQQGGKGFGRFTCLKYFENVSISSTFKDFARHKTRTFSMGRGTEIIVDEKLLDVSTSPVGTIVTLSNPKKNNALPGRVDTLARSLVEFLLPYFTTEGYQCPRIELFDNDGESITLNDYIESATAVIYEIPLQKSRFELVSQEGAQEFYVKVFKMLSPKNRVSKVSLVAHRREVTDTPLSQYIPEFAEEFVEIVNERPRNFILKTYVFGNYLDANVELERGGFTFSKDTDLALGISQSDIEKAAAELTKEAVVDQVTGRQARKRKVIEEYVEKSAPWYKPLLKQVDTSSFPLSPTESEIDSLLHREKFKIEVHIRKEVEAVLAASNLQDVIEKAGELVNKISESSKNELVHYIAIRRQVLELFERGLDRDENGRYRTEGAVHDIIFPRKRDNQALPYENHNLWILDERLTFTTYLSSDLPLHPSSPTDKPDLLAFDQPVAFRAENEPSNPVTIFEFKRPMRDNFVDPASKEDPVQQIIRYVNAIRDGRFKTPTGREIRVTESTPFFGYVICDLTPKVKRWLEREKNFTPMPDGLGWFDWSKNINLYIEVLDWTKLLKDAAMRNRVFFHKLGIF